ncbi:SUF system NifU family Fe-S cluster assembly protein [bacterium]|nr:SUF system NifU family Fe-S cluster assembly protein [bacterium]
MNDSFYGEVLTEHYLYPRHQRQLATYDRRQVGVNASCGDSLELQIKFAGDRIQDLAFSGQGCALSRASSDIVCGLLQGRSLSEAQKIIVAFDQLAAGQAHEEQKQLLGEAVSLESALQMPLRTKCVQLAWTLAAQLLRPMSSDNKNET